MTHYIAPMPSEDEWAEADMTADDALGKPLPRTPEQGLADMQRRIKHLEARCANPALAADLLRELRNQLAQARHRLAEYQAQLKGRN